MKRLSVISVVLVSLLTLGLLFVSCDSPEDAVPAADDLSFVGARGDNTVIITISQADPSRAVLTPKSGNFYTIKEENTLISKGKITIVGNRWTFTPSPDSPGNKTAFNATYSNETLTIDSIPDTEITGLTAAKGNGVIDERPSLTGTVTISKKTSIKVGDTLKATYASGNGTGTQTWKWFRGNDVIEEANSATYKVVAADAGKTLKVQVSFENQRKSVSSAETSAVLEPPVLTGTVTITGTAQVGQTLTAITNALGGSGTISYQWKRGDTPVGTSSSTYKLTDSDKGSTITVTVSRAGNSGSVTSDATAVVGDPSLPALTGSVTINNTTPKVGDTLTATYSDGNGTGTATWQWYRGDTAISGKTASTYTVVAEDVGKTLKAQVSYANQSGVKASSPTAAVLENKPALTGTVTINNTNPKVGDTLTATYSGGNGTGTAAWQWFRDDTAISGKTASTYTVVAEDVGKTLKAEVSYANQSGVKASNPTAAVLENKPALTGTVTINNTTPKVGDTLTATYSGGNGTGTAAWQWFRGDTAISGKTASTYTVVAEDVGKTLKAEVSYANQSGVKASNPTAAVLENKPALTGTVTINNTNPKVGDTLTATYSGGNGAGTAAWQWFRGDTAISGKTASTYTVVAEDVGETLKAEVSFANQSGVKTSNPTAAVTNSTSSIIPVSDITGVQTSAYAGTSFTLTKNIIPSNATNKTVVWSIQSAGTTGATISGSTLTTTAAGTVTVRATITNGTAPGTDYTQDFPIEIKPPYTAVTNITGVPATGIVRIPLTLTSTVIPSDASNQTIVWSVYSAGTTGATISGNTLHTTATGTVKVRATITNGRTTVNDYTKDFDITIYGPSTVYVDKDNIQIGEYPDLKVALDSITAAGNYRVRIAEDQNIYNCEITGSGKVITLAAENGSRLVQVDTSDIANPASAAISRYLFRINTGNTLILDPGFTLKGITNNRTTLVMVSGGTFIMKNGTITGNNATVHDGSSRYDAYNGGGVRVTNGGTFTMENGTITGNSAYYGGGVSVASGCTFTMNGGTISDNTASHLGGGGVYNEGTFTMESGIISGNISTVTPMSSYQISSDVCGGGVYSKNGTFTMRGGTISGNTVDNNGNGGGVCNRDSSNFLMQGGTISGNSAAQGGGVYAVNSSSSGYFLKTGGTIYGYSLGNANSNRSRDDNNGNAVYAGGSTRKRNSDAGPTVDLDSRVAGAAGGWE